jgi:hypothetical protein
MSAPARRVDRMLASATTPEPTSRCPLAWKMAGIILYVDPLPMPLVTKRTTKPTR